MKSETKNLYAFGPFRFYPREHLLSREDRPIPLPPKAIELLYVLVENAGHLVEKEDLMKQVWPDTYVEEGNLNKNISTLRKTLGQWDGGREYIETVPKRGYRFSVAVEGSGTSQPLPDESARKLTEPVPEHLVEAAHLPISLSTAERRSRKKLAVGLALLASILVTITLISSHVIDRGLDGQPEKLELRRLTNNRNIERVAISPDGRYIVYAERSLYGLGLWVRQTVVRSRDLEILPPEIVDLKGLTFSPTGDYVYFVRSEMDNPATSSLYVTPVLGGPTKLLLRDVDSPVSFSPDGQHFVFTRGIPNQNAIQLRVASEDGSDDRLLETFQDAAPIHQSGPAWSQDGRFIAVSVMFMKTPLRWALKIVRVGERSVQELYSSPYKIGRPLWLPPGNELLVALDDQSNHGQLFAISFPRGEARRLTNDLADYEDDRIDVTRDGKTAVIIEWDESGDLWQAPAAELTKAHQLESSSLALLNIAAGPDGKILATSLDNQLWIMNSDGAQRTLFTDLHPASTPCFCGEYILFLLETIQGDSVGLIRTNLEGANEKKLIAGNVGSPVCSPDGKFVFYTSQDPEKIFKLSVTGGAPIHIADTPGIGVGRRLALSPDGTLLAYIYRGAIHGSSATEILAVISARDGLPLKKFIVPEGISRLRWSPDGKGVQYKMDAFASTATNIWEQPVSGGERRQLTNFGSGRIFDFDWSADKKSLLMIRGDFNGDVVLLSKFH